VPPFFLTDGLAEPITVVSSELSDGTMFDCYKIIIKGIPADHSMDPGAQVTFRTMRVLVVFRWREETFMMTIPG